MEDKESGAGGGSAFRDHKVPFLPSIDSLYFLTCITMTRYF